MFRRVNNNKFGVIEYAIDSEEDLLDLPREDTNNTVYAILRKDGKKLVYLYSKEIKDYILINGDLEEINVKIENINEQLDNIASDMLPDVMKKISNKEAIKIVGFGDSTMFGTGLSEGEKNVLDWLKQKISYIYNNNNLTFINSGMPGNSTDNMLSQIKGKVLDYNPNMCIFWSGLNDVNFLTIEQYKSNVRSIIIELRNNNIVPLICSPIPSMKKDDDYNFKVGKYAQAIKEVCIEKNVNFIDIYEEFSKLILNEVITYKDYLDTVHVNTRACKYMSDIILKELLYDYKCKLNIDELLPIESPFVKCDVDWRYVANDIPNVNNICYVLDGSNNRSVKFALWVNNNESFLEIQSYLENNLAQIQVKDFGDDYKILDFKTDETLDYCGYVNMELTSGLHFFEFSNSNILKGKLGLYSFKLRKNEKENPLLHFSRVDLVPENGWQLSPSNYEKFEAIKDGYKVTIQGLITGGSENDDTVVTTLPEGYRPKATIFRDGYCLDADGVQQSILFELRASGEVLYVKFKGKNWLSFNGISFYI